MAATLSDVLREIFGAQAPNPNGPPVPTEQQAMPQNAAEPLSVPVPNIAPEVSPNTPLPAGADNPMIAAIKRMFSSPPQPADGMDAATYQPGRKMPTGADWVVPAEGPTVTVDPRKPAPPAGAPTAPLPEAVAVPPRRTAGVTYGDARIPPGMMPRGPGDVPELPVGGVRRGPGPAPAADGSNEMARMFRNFFQGAASVNPTSPKFSAFAQGAAGSMTANYQEKQAEEQRKAQRERQGFEDDLKVGAARRNDALARSLIDYRGKKVGAEGGVTPRRMKEYEDALYKHDVWYNNRLKDLREMEKNAAPPERIAKEREAVERDYERRRAETKARFEQGKLTPDMPEKGAEKPAGAKPEPGAVVEKGGAKWKFKGGDPSDKNNWEAVR